MPSSYLAIVCNSAGNSLSTYTLRDGGQLTHLADIPLSGVGAPSGSYPMALNADRTRLYVAFRGQPHEVLTFAIDAAGRSLTLLGRAPLADSMAHIAVDGTGRFLLSASFGGGKLGTNGIGPDGVATGPIDTVAVEPNMHCCIPLAGTGMFFATSLGDDSTLKFEVDANGKLTRLPQRADSAKGSGPRHFVFHPSVRYGYLVTQTASTVDVFGFDGTALSAGPIQTISILPPNWRGEPWAADIRISPDGRFLYATDRKADSIALFTVDAATGRLTAQGHTFAAPWPRAFNLTPDGAYLLALGENTNRLEVFGIDPTTGALDKRHALPTGAAPSWVEIIAL